MFHGLGGLRVGYDRVLLTNHSPRIALTHVKKMTCFLIVNHPSFLKRISISWSMVPQNKRQLQLCVFIFGDFNFYLFYFPTQSTTLNTHLMYLVVEQTHFEEILSLDIQGHLLIFSMTEPPNNSPTKKHRSSRLV